MNRASQPVSFGRQALQLMRFQFWGRYGRVRTFRQGTSSAGNLFGALFRIQQVFQLRQK